MPACDWIRLGWVMLRGRAEILRDGNEHDHAQELLRSRYRQLAATKIADRPVIAVRLERVKSWGACLSTTLPSSMRLYSDSCLTTELGPPRPTA